MSTPLACVICSLDPQNTALILPIAQATIVAAPLILRNEIRKGAHAVRARRASRGAAASTTPAASATGPSSEVDVGR